MDTQTTTETVQEQATQVGDVPASQEGQLESSASSTPPAAQPKEEEKQETTDSAKNDEAKKWRKSDKEWQETQEKAKKLEETVKAESEEKKSLQTRLEQLEELSQRKDWEADHPIVRDERYKEAWDQVNKEERYKTLTYDERWKLINREDASQVNRTLAEQAARTQGSVPPSSRSTSSKPGLDPATLDMGKAWGNSEEDFRKYGVA